MNFINISWSYSEELFLSSIEGPLLFLDSLLIYSKMSSISIRLSVSSGEFNRVVLSSISFLKKVKIFAYNEKADFTKI